MTTLIAMETTVRLAAFLGVLAIMAVWEGAMPRRPRTRSRRLRWPVNFGLIAIDAALLRLLFPAALVGVALWAEAQGLGMFNRIEAPLWLAVGLCVILLDLAVYGQHVATHAIPLLWRLHRVHHLDLDVDVSTGIRFHPIEIVLSHLFKAAVVIALGAPVVAVILFEIILNATSLFNHSNIRLPRQLDAALRLLIVTPDMHRVHHSILERETNSNYGFALSIWDRLFRSYRHAPEAGQMGVVLGLKRFREETDQGLIAILANPLHGPSR